MDTGAARDALHNTILEFAEDSWRQCLEMQAALDAWSANIEARFEATRLTRAPWHVQELHRAEHERERAWITREWRKLAKLMYPHDALEARKSSILEHIRAGAL